MIFSFLNDNFLVKHDKSSYINLLRNFIDKNMLKIKIFIDFLWKICEEDKKIFEFK